MPLPVKVVARAFSCRPLLHRNAKITGTDLVEFSRQLGLDEAPTLVVFNGQMGSLTEEGTLHIKTTDRVRIYFGNAGPNKISSFHVIGAIFDKVFREGSLEDPPARGIQTTLFPAGGATVVEFVPRSRAPIHPGGPRHLPRRQGRGRLHRGDRRPAAGDLPLRQAATALPGR